MPRIKWPAHLPTWLRDYPIEFLRCRCRGHQWDDEGSFSTSKVGKGLEAESYLCLSCKSQRFDVFDIYNRELWARDYDVPNGYYLDGEDQLPEPKAIYLLAYHARTAPEKTYVDPPPEAEKTIARAVRKAIAAEAIT